MPQDPELDRLKTAQELAFQRKQSVWQIQQHAWELRKAARERMNAAFERKQRAFDAQRASGEAYFRIKSANGPQIDALDAQQERAFQEMGRAFEESKDAYRSRDGAAARRHADSGNSFRSESQRCVRERRNLVQQIRDAWSRHEPNQRAFQDAKASYAAARADFDAAKAAHERAGADFKAARETHERAKQDFKDRLEAVRAQRQIDNRSLAERAGVPFGYRDNVRVSTQANGSINIYFGGEGAPDGEGHGHYSMDPSGRVTYRRDPFDPHGAHNFTDAAEWHKVRMSFDRDSGTYQTDNYIGIVGDAGQKSKAHIVVDAEGDVVYVRDIGGEVLYSRKDGIGHLPDDLDWSH